MPGSNLGYLIVYEVINPSKYEIIMYKSQFFYNYYEKKSKTHNSF